MIRYCKLCALEGVEQLASWQPVPHGTVDGQETAWHHAWLCPIHGWLTKDSVVSRAEMRILVEAKLVGIYVDSTGGRR